MQYLLVVIISKLARKNKKGENMNHQINIVEIIIMNCSGICCLLFLVGTRLSNQLEKRVGENLFNSMITVTVLSLALELFTFVIDGRPGRFIYIGQYISNALLVPATTLMGYLWCLFVEFKIFHSIKRTHKAAFFWEPLLWQYIFWLYWIVWGKRDSYLRSHLQMFMQGDR